MSSSEGQACTDVRQSVSECPSANVMRPVDTQVLVRLVARDNREQCQAAEAFVASGAWVSHLVLAETVWVLDALHERTHEQIVTAIDLLLNHKALTIQDASVVSAALRHFRKRPTLGFSDCLQMACSADL